jgi:hypothetical protein
MHQLKFEEQLVEVHQDCKKVTDHSRGMNGIRIKRKGREGKPKGDEVV